MSVIDSDRPAVVDYDSFGYDYRSYWLDRRYEERAEHAALTHVLNGVPLVEWAADLGGGYGRNVDQLLTVAQHVVLVDYSRTNLATAARRFATQITDGRVHLLRADLHTLPLRDRAVDAALAVRVLHHLPDLADCLPEWTRVIGSWAVLDVPIKHHVLARLRHPTHRADAAPRLNGHSQFPFAAFDLRDVRRRLRDAGFDSTVSASVNNFRRWDQVVPDRGVDLLAPVVHTLELAFQRLGRGWWGPSQFVLADRRDGSDGGRTAARAGLAGLLHCPNCRGDVDLLAAGAHCPWCQINYPRRDGYWDFTR